MSRGQRIHISKEIRDDIHSVKKITTSAGNVRFDVKRTEKSHADRFWALALAIHAGTNPSGPIEFETTGHQRAFTEMAGYLR